jgi:hypothetical protein
MPRLSVWLIRSALIYLATGFTLGALLLANKGVSISPWLWRLLPAHIEIVLFGWTVQLAMGVAFWILPRLVVGAPRGNERWVWLAYGCLNVGILAATLGQILLWPGWVLVSGRVAELAAIALFVRHAWPRVKALGT